MIENSVYTNTQEADEELQRAERISFILGRLKQNGVPQNTIAHELSITPQAVARWKKTGQISASSASFLATKSGANFEWIYHGTGEPYLAGNEKGPSQLEFRGPDYIEIPMLALFCNAGSGDSTSDYPPAFLKHLSFRRDWLQHEKLDPEHLQCGLVDGDSMIPTLYDDDVILIDTSNTSHDEIKNNKVYAIYYKDKPSVKRLSRQEYGGIIIKAEDKSLFADVVEPIEAVEIIGRVVWAGGKVR